MGSNSQLGDIDDFGKDNIEIDSHNDSTIKDGGRNVMGLQRASFNQSVDKIFDNDQKFGTQKNSKTKMTNRSKTSTNQSARSNDL